MSRLLYLSVKEDKKLFEKLKQRALKFLSEIQPPDIELNKEIILENANSLTVLVNPTKAVKIIDQNALIGLCYANDKNEWLEFGEMPDGNFVIKREKDQVVEILTDYQATKSLWYFFDKKILIVSSSQRMIVHLLGSFQLNEQTVMWMLSSGTLGLYNSWDKRIKSLPPATILKFDKNKWKIKLLHEPIIFKSNNLSLKENTSIFNGIIDKVFSNISLDEIKSLLSITGGYDSRSVLIYLYKNHKKFDLMTIGTKNSIDTKFSDLYISREIANYFELKWFLFDTNLKIINISAFFDTMLKLGEGRLDLIDRMTDDFTWFREMSNRKYDVLFNGMEGFSCQYPFNNSNLNLRLRKLYLLKDFKNVNLDFNIAQAYHEDLLKKENETYNQNYYKINQLFFNPYGDAALNEIQNCYLDVLNPLLSKSIITFIRLLPDKQRIQKHIAKEIVKINDVSNIPFSDKVSVLSTNLIIKTKLFSSYFDKYLFDHNSIFGSHDINQIISATKKGTIGNEMITYNNGDVNKYTAIKKSMEKNFPYFVHKFIEFKKRYKPNKLDPHLLKYRMFIVTKMVKQFEDDSR